MSSLVYLQQDKYWLKLQFSLFLARAQNVPFGAVFAIWCYAADFGGRWMHTESQVER